MRKLQRVLVIGADGGLGGALRECLKRQGVEVVGTSRRVANQFAGSVDGLVHLDLADPGSIASLPLVNYSTVVICAGISSVEFCESNPDVSRRVNLYGVLAVFSRAIAAHCHVVYLSSNLVFDGSRPAVSTSDSSCPTCEYGWQKSEVERQIALTSTDYAIVRLTKVVPPVFPLFDSWISDLSSGNSIFPCENKHMAPIAMQFVVSVLAAIVTRAMSGIFHVSASHDISYYDAALALAARIGVSKELVVPKNCSSAIVGSVKRLSSLSGDGLAVLGVTRPDPFEAIYGYVSSGASAR